MTKQIHVYISGHVQGVGFRIACKKQADGLGVAGWVKNLNDGRVEAVFAGSDDILTPMLAWCMTGPAGAMVTGIEKQKEEAAGLEQFHIR